MKLNKKHLITFIRTSLVSLAIGTTFLLAFSPQSIYSLKWMLFNSGYSLMMGFGLFCNGLVFNFFDKRYLSWLKKPAKSVVTAIVVTLLYSSIVIIFTNWFWYIYIGNHTWEQFWIWGKTVIIWEYVMLYVVSSMMYASSFFQAWRKNVIEKEKLKNEALALQYETLSNQVNPHFLFNSLNVLLSMIDTDTAAAKRFTTQLSNFYRQLLSLKDKQLLPIDEELTILRNYLDLQQIRFGESLRISMNLPADESHLIIPLTLQMLVENAFKHNILSPEQPLTLTIEKSDNQLIVRNNLQKRKNVMGSSQIGLRNLNERYQFLTGHEIEVVETTQSFEVKIPLIEIEA